MNPKPLQHASFVVLGLALCSSLAVAAIDTTKSAGTVVDDAVITTRVKAALVGDPATKARNIEVETSRGVVQLSGAVDSEDAKAEAERVAGTVKGVRAVRNKIDVR